MTAPIEITPEVRQAVLTAECERLGHDITNVNTLLRLGDLAGPDDDTLPHIVCGRCDAVWVQAADPGTDYADAVVKEKARVKDPDSVRPRRRARR